MNQKKSSTYNNNKRPNYNNKVVTENKGGADFNVGSKFGVEQKPSQGFDIKMGANETL